MSTIEQARNQAWGPLLRQVHNHTAWSVLEYLVMPTYRAATRFPLAPHPQQLARPLYLQAYWKVWWRVRQVERKVRRPVEEQLKEDTT